MGVERIEPGAPAAPVVGQSFGEPPDKFFQAEPVAPAAAEPIAPAAAEPAAAPAAPVAPAPGEPEPDMFPRAYVEDLRRENQTYRQRAQAADSLFEGWHPDDKAFVENLLRDSVANPAAAAANWQHAAEVFGAYGEEMPGGVVGDPTGAAAAGDPQYLTPADLNRVLDERDQRAKAAEQNEAQQRSIVDKATQLGYTPDQNNPEYVALLNFAVKETNGDLDQAHARVQQWKQGFVDQYLAAQAQAANGLPTPTPTGAGPMPTGEPITNLKQSRAGLEAFLDQQLGART